MDYEAVREGLGGLPFMTPRQGLEIYEHIRRTRPVNILELGTARGASAAYMAAALEANGDGHLTTVDIRTWDPSASETLERLGLSHRVTVVVLRASSYNWFLKEQIEKRSDSQGNCEPLYDFCYLDGPHEWNVDGLASLLVEKLLLPNSWILFDDFNWTMSDPEPVLHPYSEEELAQPHVRKIFELLVMQHPSFTQFRIEDDSWAWAQKAPMRARRMSLETRHTFGDLALRALRTLRGKVNARTRGRSSTRY